VLGDPIWLRGRATRKRLNDSAGKPGDKFLVKLTFSYLFSFRLSPPSAGVFQAFCFSFFDRLSLSQNTLAVRTFSAFGSIVGRWPSTGVFRSPLGQGRIAAGEKFQVIEVTTIETERTALPA
jgi:hypothetical protein